jgi:hypothetical protein
MNVDLLEPVALLEELDGSAVFPPREPPPAPSVMNSWIYLTGALDTREAYFAKQRG